MNNPCRALILVSAFGVFSPNTEAQSNCISFFPGAQVFLAGVDAKVSFPDPDPSMPGDECIETSQLISPGNYSAEVDCFAESGTFSAASLVQYEGEISQDRIFLDAYVQASNSPVVAEAQDSYSTADSSALLNTFFTVQEDTTLWLTAGIQSSNPLLFLRPNIGLTISPPDAPALEFRQWATVDGVQISEAFDVKAGDSVLLQAVAQVFSCNRELENPDGPCDTNDSSIVMELNTCDGIFFANGFEILP